MIAIIKGWHNNNFILELLYCFHEISFLYIALETLLLTVFLGCFSAINTLQFVWTLLLDILLSKYLWKDVFQKLKSIIGSSYVSKSCLKNCLHFCMCCRIKQVILPLKDKKNMPLDSFCPSSNVIFQKVSPGCKYLSIP